MMLDVVRDRTRVRFNEVQIYLNYIGTLEPKEPSTPVPVEVRIMKGLFQVHLYSAFEKTINDIIETTLINIASMKIKNLHFVPSFSSISMKNKLKSLKDSGYAKFFQKAIELFEEEHSSNVAIIDESIFSNSLQNVWMKTIDEVMKAFGCDPIAIDASNRAAVDELVEKRNAVAHGRENAAAVGERYRVEHLRRKFDVIVEVTYQIVDGFDQYHSHRKFIKPNLRRHYAKP